MVAPVPSRPLTPSRRAVLTPGALLLAVVALTGCTTGLEERPDNTAQREPARVGAIMYARDLEYWQLIEAGMRQAARELGVPLNVDVSNRELQTESQLMDTMYARGDNVILAAPFDTEASAAAFRRARARGLTLVQYDNRVADASFDYFVGVDQVTLGATCGAAAQEVIDAEFGGRAKVALLTGDTEPNGPPRREAFLSVATGADVVTTAEAVGTPEAGAQAFETILQSHPDVEVVWAWNGAALQGAATTARRMDSSVRIVGIDMSRQVADLLRNPDGPVAAVADQNAYDVGHATLTAGVRLAQGEDVPRRTAIDPLVYRAGDDAALDEFAHDLGDR